MKVWREAEERCDAEDWDKWPSFHIAEDILTQNLDKMIMHVSCQKQSLWLIVSHAHSPRSFYPPPPLSTKLTESIQTSAAALKPLKLQVSQFTTELSEPWQQGSESEGKLKVFLFRFFFFFTWWIEIPLDFAHFGSPSVRNGNWAINPGRRERWIDSREREDDVEGGREKDV